MGNYCALVALRTTVACFPPGLKLLEYYDINTEGPVRVLNFSSSSASMSLNWAQNSQLADVRALYSKSYDDKAKFPWDVRNELGPLLYEHEFNLESSPQAKSRYLDTIAKHIDELETKNPVVVESYTEYRELFKRKKADLYDLLAASIEWEKSYAIGAHNRAESSDDDESDDEMSVDDNDSPDEFIEDSEDSSVNDFLEQPSFVPLNVTLSKLDIIVSQH